MNKEKIKAAFRQVYEDCLSRGGICKPADISHCKHVELCEKTKLNISDQNPGVWNLK